jgi:hypothetical protein
MSEPLIEQPPVEPAAEPAVEPAAPAWSGPTQEEWEATQQQLQQYEQLLQPQPPPQYGPTLSEYPTGQEIMDFIAYSQQGVNQFEQEVRLAQAEEQAMSRLDELAAAGGDFDRDTAFARANMIMVQQGGGDPMRALEQAARETREYEQRVGQAFYDRQIEQLQTNANAPRGLPATGGGSAQLVPTGGLGNVPNAVTRKFFGGNG